MQNRCKVQNTPTGSKLSSSRQICRQMMMNGSLQNCKPLTNVANCEGKGERGEGGGAEPKSEREESSTPGSKNSA